MTDPPVSAAPAQPRREGPTSPVAVRAGSADAEQLLRQAREFATLAEHVPDGVLRIGTDQTYLYANPAIARMLGLTVEEIVGQPVGTVVRGAGQLDEWRDALRRCLSGEGPITMTLSLRDGERLRWVESRFVPERAHDDGPLESVLVVARDVTERRRAEQALERLAALVRSSEDAIVGISLDDVITSWNPAAERTFGYPEADAVGRSADFFIAPHARAEARALRRRVALGESVSHSSLWHRRSDGREIPIAVTMAPVRDASGAVTGVSAIKRDMTAQQLLETQLREAQKMEAVGRLAGGIAHDFNNLLTAILASAELSLANPALAERASADSSDAVDLPPATVAELRTDLTEIRAAAMRAAELTKQLLAFSRRQVLLPQLLDVNEVIESAGGLLRRAVGDGATMRLALGADLPLVVADRGQLEQVLLNLALNARDAMAERVAGAELSIETSLLVVHETDAPLPAAGATVAPGRYVAIVARDNGVGMDAAVAARVFEPFFTTKEVGKGTGLGLAMAYGIVTQSGGYISASGEPGVGSRFTIYLPVAPEGGYRASAAARAPSDALD